MATYGSGTMNFMEEMGDKELEQSEYITLENKKKVKRIVLKGKDFERVLPNKRDLANQVLCESGRASQEAFLTVERKKLLAERNGKNWTLLHHIVNDNKPNEATQDLILCSVLLRDQVPSAEETDHILLMMQRESLYTYTDKRAVNCRNFLIRKCLDYASRGNFCPVSDWLVFTNSVIMHFASRLKLILQPLDAWTPDFSFIGEYSQLLEGWEQQLKKVGFCYLNEYRDALIEAYLAQHGEMRSRAAVQNKLSEKFLYHDSYTRAIFSATGNRTGSRDALIRFATELGCNLKEANLLLRQANYAPVYPYRGVNNADDALGAQKLNLNKGLLTPEKLEKFLMKGAIDYE